MQNLTIHQIWYRDEQQASLDPAMRPWDNRENLRPEWCEYWIMRQAAARFDEHFNELTGFFSWKYREKLSLEHRQIKAFIETQPGMDCYIFSPAVFQVACYLNVWQQGEIWHKGITRNAQALLERLGYRSTLEHSVDHHLNTAYANFWIASRPFWKAYLAFMERVFADIEGQKEIPGNEFWSAAYGSKGGSSHIQALPIIPYLVERLFPVFLRLHPEFRVTAWEYPLPVLQERTFPEAALIPLANWSKLMFCQTGERHYLQVFGDLQARLFAAAQKALDEHPGRAIR